MTRPLNERQKRFVEEYLIDLDQKKAYIRAGYKNSKDAAVHASALYNLPHVNKAIKDAMDKRSEECGIKAKYVLEAIVETIERCRQSEPVKDRNGKQVFVATKTGDVVPAYTFEANNVLKGAELLGKHLRMFADKVEMTGKDGGAIKHEHGLTPEVSKEEWLKLHGVGTQPK